MFRRIVISTMFGSFELSIQEHDFFLFFMIAKVCIFCRTKDFNSFVVIRKRGFVGNKTLDQLSKSWPSG